MYERSMLAVRHGARLTRTSPVRLGLKFGLWFSVGLVLLNSVIFLNATHYLERQGDEIVLGQAKVLASIAPERLPARIREAELGDLREVNHFGLFDAHNRSLAGTVEIWPVELAADGQPRALRSAGFQYGARAVAIDLHNGTRLVVAYDAKTLTGLSVIVREAVAWSAVVAVSLALILGALFGMRPLRRLLRLQATSDRIAAGNLALRLPVSDANDELDMLAELINKMLAQIQTLIEEIKSVGDNLAHDLRSPLGHLRAQLLHCLQEWPALSDSRKLADVECAMRSADTLLSRFNALQRIAELDSRKRFSQMKAISLEELCATLAESHEALAESANIVFEHRFPSHARVMADPELIAEALINLLDNAFKFTPPRRTVCCTVLVEQSSAVIEVLDEGPGVPEDELLRVLERKARGYHTQAFRGTGLGLAIVQAVARVHGWQLELSNRKSSSGLRARLIAPLYADGADGPRRHDPPS